MDLDLDQRPLVFPDAQTYSQRFLGLVRLERDSEIEAAQREMASLSAEARQGLGRCVLGLRPSDKGPWIGGRRLIQLFRPAMPETNIGPGDAVVISLNNPLREGLNGVVLEKTSTGFVVVVETPLPRSWRNIRLDLQVNDTTFQRMFSALRNLEAGLFPVEFILGKARPGFGEVEVNLPDRLNSSQKSAVRAALACEPWFALHGPFGTGKTTTLAEIVRQLMRQGQRVLVTGDSNAAVDNMLAGLTKLGLEPVRIGHPAKIAPELVNRSLDVMAESHPDAPRWKMMWQKVDELREQQQRYPRATPGERRGYSYEELVRMAEHNKSGRGISRDKIKSLAAWARLQLEINRLISEAISLQDKAISQIISRAQLVCSTNSGAGSEFLENQEFDTVIIDEATQATEPSCLIPVIKARRVIAAGDPKQLPPTITSIKALKAGLDFTMFERFFRLHPRASALLDIQYRMHPDIMEFPNKAFYQGKLRSAPGLEKMRLSQLLEFEAKNPCLDDRPVVFVDTGGLVQEHKRPGSSSTHNPHEAQLVKTLVKDLLAAGAHPEQIGVIAPYDDQVKLLRQILPPDVKVKTVDGFQGSEKEVIILSLVRSNPKRNIGFLRDRRRLNVAMTRPRRKLIMIGDANTLSSDLLYRELVNFLKAKGLFIPSEQVLSQDV